MARARPVTERPRAEPASSAPGAGHPAWLAALAAIVAVAALLRVLRLGHGLPDVTDEDYPFRVALTMWGWDTGRIDWNPHFFIYPTFSIYLHFLVQQAAVAAGTLAGTYASPADYRLAFDVDPTPMVVLARAVHVGWDLATVAGVAVLGERLRRGAGLPAALLVTLAPLLVVTSRSVYSDTPLAALAVWSLERLVAWRERGGRVRLVTAVVLAGLAAGTKYPGGLLVVPIVWAILERRGWRGIAPAALAAAAAFGVFLLTSPYVLLDFAAFRRHFASQTEHMALGHLGHLTGPSFGVHLGTLGRNFGWAGVAALAGSLALAFDRGTAGRAARLMWAFVLPLGIAFGAARTPMERYLIPLIAAAAPLVTATVIAAAGALGRSWGTTAARPALRPAAAALGLAAILVPVAIAGVSATVAGAGHTQDEARAWLAAHLGARELVVQEGYGAPLTNRARRDAVTGARYFRAASEPMRRRFLEQSVHHAVTLPLYVEGRAVVPVRAPAGGLTPVELFPFAADFTRIYYDLRLFAGVDWVVTSAAVRGRYEADPARFAAQAAFYAFLDREAEPAARFEARGEVTGPEIRIYRLGERARRAIRAAGPLPALWWAESVPASYRHAADRAATAATLESGGALRTPDGRLAPWVHTLSAVYERRVAPFTERMATELGRIGRIAEAERFARANLTIVPGDEDAFRLFVLCVHGRQPPARARATVESTLVALAREDEDAAALRDAYESMVEDLEHGGFDQ